MKGYFTQLKYLFLLKLLYIRIQRKDFRTVLFKIVFSTMSNKLEQNDKNQMKKEKKGKK